MITSGSMTFVSGLQLSLTIIYLVEIPGVHTLEALKACRKVLRITMLIQAIVFHIIHLNHVVNVIISSWVLTCGLLLWSW